MNAADTCRAAGLSGLREMSEICEVPQETLRGWFVSRPKVFSMLLSECVRQAGATGKREATHKDKNGCLYKYDKGDWYFFADNRWYPSSIDHSALMRDLIKL